MELRPTRPSHFGDIHGGKRFRQSAKRGCLVRCACLLPCQNIAPHSSWYGMRYGMRLCSWGKRVRRRKTAEAMSWQAASGTCCTGRSIARPAVEVGVLVKCGVVGNVNRTDPAQTLHCHGYCQTTFFVVHATPLKVRNVQRRTE